MNFIEDVFHIAPDGGGGWLEALLFFLVPLALAVLKIARGPGHPATALVPGYNGRSKTKSRFVKNLRLPLLRPLGIEDLQKVDNGLSLLD